MSRERVAHLAPPRSSGNWIAPDGQAVSTSDSPSPRDRAFIALQNAYRPHGGLSRLNGLAAARRYGSDERDNGISGLVDAGRLFSFRWHADIWVPMFQFDFSGTTAATGPQRVVAELGPGFDGWALARWFVQPNDRLADRRPVECLDSHLPDVLEAARAARFVTTG